MISKILSVAVGAGCIIAAAFRQNGPDPMAPLVAGFLAAFGMILVLCSSFLGGFTSRFGGMSRIADSPKLYGGGIFIFLGRLLIAMSLTVVVWLYWPGHPF